MTGVQTCALPISGEVPAVYLHDPHHVGPLPFPQGAGAKIAFHLHHAKHQGIRNFQAFAQLIGEPLQIPGQRNGREIPGVRRQNNRFFEKSRNPACFAHFSIFPENGLAKCGELHYNKKHTLRNYAKKEKRQVLFMKRESFRSRLGFLLVSAGCAIEIGRASCRERV